jgi:hypothetical protein
LDIEELKWIIEDCLKDANSAQELDRIEEDTLLKRTE